MVHAVPVAAPGHRRAGRGACRQGDRRQGQRRRQQSHRLAVPRHEHPNRHLLCGRCGEGTPDRRTAKAEIYRHTE